MQTKPSRGRGRPERETVLRRYLLSLKMLDCLKRISRMPNTHVQVGAPPPCCSWLLHVRFDFGKWNIVRRRELSASRAKGLLSSRALESQFLPTETAFVQTASQISKVVAVAGAPIR